MTSEQPNPILACNIHAIPQEVRPLHQANTECISAAVQEVHELPTGYALRLPNETDMLQTIVAFISYERLCCPFFRFGLEIEPEQGPVWLSLTGATNVKAFLQSEGFTLPAVTFPHRTEPIGRLGTTQEIANAVAWLCSDESSFVTGVPFPVDGGVVAQ